MHFPTRSHFREAEDAVEHQVWCDAREQVLDAVHDGPAMMLILGESGTGKSLLLQNLAWRLGATGANVVLQPRGDLRGDILTAGDASKRWIVLIDEAHRMDAAALGRLAQLKPYVVVLAGVSDPRSAIDAFAGAKIVRLAPLSDAGVRSFVHARLAQAGLPADLVGPSSMAELVARSGGIPRTLDALLRAALVLAARDGVSRPEVTHIGQAAALPDEAVEPDISIGFTTPIPSPRSPRRRNRVAGVLVGFAAMSACAWLVVQWSDPFESSSLISTKTPPSFDLEATAADASAPLSRAAESTTTPGQPEPPSALASAAPPPDAVVPLSSPPSKTLAGNVAIAGRSVPQTSLALPVGAPVRVVIRYRGGGKSVATAIEQVEASLLTAGFLVDVEPIGPGVSAAPGARYVFAEDRPAAEAILALAGLRGQSRRVDTGEMSGTMFPGIVELTMPTNLRAAGRG